MKLTIRQIRPEEGLRLRDLRLRALADAPTAFGSTLAREEAFADTVWHDRAASGAQGGCQATLVAEHGGGLVGLATGVMSEGQPLLVGMFVAREARRLGVATALVEGVAAWAAPRGTSLRLWVTSANAAAIALYRKCGFRPTGHTRPLAHTPALTEMEMLRTLAAKPL